jgi:CHRD domain-containing protein
MRKRRLFSALIFAVPVVLAGTFAVAGDSGKSHFKADTLTGYQESAAVPISTTGTGSFEASLNGAGDEISYTLTYSDLEGVANNGVVTQAHIHFGQRGINGGVIAFLCGGPKPACPASPATVTGTISPADILGPTTQGIEPGSFDEAVRALRAGMVYANVHTTRWPSGEVRGQINDQNQRGE